MADETENLPINGGDDYVERVSFKITPNRAPLIGWSAAFLLPCILIFISFITNGFSSANIPDVLVIILLLCCAAFTLSYAFSGITANGERLSFRNAIGRHETLNSSDIEWARVTRSSFTLRCKSGKKLFLGGCEPGRLKIYLEARGIEIKKDKK